MTLFDYAIMAIAIVVVTLAAGVSSLFTRKLPGGTVGRPAVDTSAVDVAVPQIHIDIPGADPMRELTRLPALGDSSALPDEAKSVLMNAVWYRCENPECNYTQFLDVYQIVSKEKGGSNSLENLVVLCPECRMTAHAGQIDDDMLRSWIQGRVERFRFALDWPYK